MTTSSTPLPRLAWLFAAVLAVCGCSSVAPPALTKPASPASQKAATPGALETERQWLQSWFKGTPVVITQRDQGTVTVDVPRSFCFDVGSSSVKPALAAVLDKVAESLRRVPLASLTLIAAPDDASGQTPLAVERASQIQKYLRSRGVAAGRLAKPNATATAAVQLRVGAALD